jgi:signal transduction histidine kinase
VERVLHNLLDNASQVHGGPAGGSVAIRMAESGGPGRGFEWPTPAAGIGAGRWLPYFLTAITDGPGNPPSAPPGGMGLGLVIVKKIWTRTGSQIMGGNRAGHRTRFWFTLSPGRM